jgi:glutamate carboxypeptidase
VINVTELNKERAMSNQVIDWLESQQDNMLDLLGELVNIDSNSFDKAGVDRVAKRLAEFFDAQSIPHEPIQNGRETRRDRV